MREIQFQKTPYGITASLVEGEKVTFGVGRTHAEAEENLREKLSEPSSESEAAPAPEAQAPAVPDSEIRKCIKSTFGTFFITGGRQYRYNESDRVALVELLKPLEAELAQLRTRVAILDAQEVGLPPTLEEFLHLPREQWEEVTHSLLWSRMIQIYPQYLDALRAVQAWRAVAKQQHEALDTAAQLLGEEDEGLQARVDAIEAYDALAGKGSDGRPNTERDQRRAAGATPQ